MKLPTKMREEDKKHHRRSHAFTHFAATMDAVITAKCLPDWIIAWLGPVTITHHKKSEYSAAHIRCNIKIYNTIKPTIVHHCESVIVLVQRCRSCAHIGIIHYRPDVTVDPKTVAANGSVWMVVLVVTVGLVDVVGGVVAPGGWGRGNTNDWCCAAVNDIQWGQT